MRWVEGPPPVLEGEERWQRGAPPMRPVRSRAPRKLAAAIRRAQTYVGSDGLVLVSTPQPTAAPAAIAAKGGDVSVTGAAGAEAAHGDVPVTDFPPEAAAKSLSVFNDSLLKRSVSTDTDNGK